MSTELVVINDEQFGKLIQLPEIYAKNKARVEKATEYAATALVAVKLVDMKTVDPVAMEVFMEPVRKLRSLLSEAQKEILEERKPHTVKMDAIKSLFTGLEKSFDQLILDASTIEDKWELAKLERKREAENQKQIEINKNHEKIRLDTLIRKNIINAFAVHLATDVSKMISALEGKDEQALDSFEKGLKLWKPTLDDFDAKASVGYLGSLLFTKDETEAMALTIVSDMEDQLANDYAAKMNEQKNKIIEMIPSVKAQLVVNAPISDFVSKEIEHIKEEIKEESESKNEAAEATASIEKMNASFDASHAAVQTVSASKGTSFKKIYQPTTHKAFLSIIQSWITNTMSALTIEELNKKLSFMVTAANDRLSDGEKLEADGLNVIDDVTTKKRRK